MRAGGARPCWSPPLSPSPHANSFIKGTAVVNTHPVSALVEPRCLTLDRARVKPGRAVAMHAQSLAGTLNVGCEPDKRRPHAATEQCEKSNFELLPHGQSSCTLRTGSPFALAPFLAFDEKQSDEQDAQKGSWSCVCLLLQDLVQSRRLTHVVLPTAANRSRIMQSRTSRT